MSPEGKEPGLYVATTEGVKTVPIGLVLNAVTISGAVIGTLLPFIDADWIGCSYVSLPTETRSFRAVIGEGKDITIYFI
jgi:hypothetical protein